MLRLGCTHRITLAVLLHFVPGLLPSWQYDAALGTLSHADLAIARRMERVAAGTAGPGRSGASLAVFAQRDPAAAGAEPLFRYHRELWWASDPRVRQAGTFTLPELFAQWRSAQAKFPAHQTWKRFMSGPLSAAFLAVQSAGSMFSSPTQIQCGGDVTCP